MAALDAKVQLRFIYNLPICEMNGVGLELGISPHTLSVIQKNNSMDVIAQKREILSQWLRQDIRASYKRLAEVLQKHDPPEMKSIEKLAMNLGCSVDALISHPVSNSMYAPDKNVLASMQIYPREKQWATSMEIIQDQMSCCSVDAPISHPVAPPSAVTITAPTNWMKGKRLGSGACGEVFICHDQDTGRELAVKMVNIEQADQHDVRMELQLLQNLRHERIVTYYGTDIRNEKLCIFMEFMPGGSVHQHMKDTRAALTETLTRKYTRQILEGVAYLHDNKIVHRDIKGANILRNSNDNIKLADFGASKRLQTICSGLKSCQGTPYWMAPEVIKQESYTGKADIWSIGATVVEMLTGDHPWHTFEPFAAMFKIGAGKHPDLPSHCSKYAEDFLLLCFNRDKSLRPSARELLDTPFVKLT